MAELELKVLENGLLLEEVPLGSRTEKVCINALQWGLKIYKTNDCNARRELCFQIMDWFPKDVLLSGFVRGHLPHFA